MLKILKLPLRVEAYSESDKVNTSVYKIIRRKLTELFSRTQKPYDQSIVPYGDKGHYFQTIIPLIRMSLPAVNIERPFKTLSTSYEVGLIDLSKGGIGFINGINTTEEEAKEHALRLSCYAQGVKVQGVYNATHTTPIDVLECLVGHCRVQTSPVQLLKNKWNQFVRANMGCNIKYLQFCHSGGAIHVLNALRDSTKKIRDRIIVIAISPAKIIPNDLCYKAHNYASRRDFIPSLDVAGKYWYADQLTVLKPHEEAPTFDHHFASATFQDVIKQHMSDYLCRYGESSIKENVKEIIETA